MKQQKQQYEDRLRKSFQRSMQKPKKKTGEPVMFRSAPIQKKVRKKEIKKEQQEDDDAEYFNW